MYKRQNYFYVAIQYNPVEIANNLRRNNGSIPGFRPGKPTSDFLTRTLNKITPVSYTHLDVYKRQHHKRSDKLIVKRAGK